MYKILAFIKKDFIIESSYKMAFLILILNSAMPLISYFFLGKMINQKDTLSNYGGDYFPFALIGVCFTTYFQTAIISFSDSIRRAQMAGCLEAILSSQTNPKSIVLYSSFYSFISSFVQILILFIIAIFIFNLNLPNINYLAFSVSFILSLLCFISLGIFAAVGTIIFKKGDPFTFLFGGLSAILGGAYFPIEIMPKWLEISSYFFPISYSLKALRLSMLNGSDIFFISKELLVLLSISLVFFPLSLFSFQKAVEVGKREGTLLQY